MILTTLRASDYTRAAFGGTENADRLSAKSLGSSLRWIMRGMKYVLVVLIAASGGSGIVQAENISCSPWFRGALSAFAGRYDDTITACNEVLRSEPENCGAYALRGYAFLRKKQHAKQAIADFSEVIRRDPDNVAIHIVRARAYLQDKDHDRAIADLSQAIRLNPRCSDAYSRRGLIYLEDKQVVCKALSDYSTALRLDPGRARTRAVRANLYRRQGKYAMALEDLERIFRADPDNELAHFIRGLVCLDRNDLDRARMDANELSRLYPKCSSGYALRSRINLVSGEGGKFCFNMLAGMLLQPGPIQIQVQHATTTNLGGFTFGPEGLPANRSDDERIAACTKRLGDDPNNVATYWERACAYYRKHDYKRAIVDVDEVVHHDPTDATVDYLRGHAHDSQKDYEHAINDFNSAIRLDPDNAENYLGRAHAYAAMRKDDKALSDCGEALRLDPFIHRAFVYRGWIYDNRKEYDKAIADYSEALRLCPSDPELYLRRATARRYTWDCVGVVADYRQIVTLEPSNIQARARLAWFLACSPDPKLRNGKEARQLATSACEASSWREPEYLDSLAAACAECGDFDRAVKWQTKALELAPQDLKAHSQHCLELYRSHKPYHQQQ